MTTIETEELIESFREERLAVVHRRVNSLAPRDQTPEFIASEMQTLDAQVAAYAASLGQPDDAPTDEPQTGEPIAPVAKPGVKQEG